jgi:hypothetical protein
MPTTICLYLRGDGATRALEAFRRALGAEAEAFSIHPNRDDTGYYGSADVASVEAARHAFSAERQPFPTLKAYIGILPAEREESAPRGGQSRAGEGRGRGQEPRSSSIRPAEGKPISNGSGPMRSQEKSRPEQSGEQGGRKPPLRFRNRNDRRKQSDRDKQA